MSDSSTLLAADIGGTKTLVRLAQIASNGSLTILRETRYNSADFAQFEELLTDFITSTDKPAAACFGVAGPIMSITDHLQRAKVTNLPWSLDSENLKTAFDIQSVRLINDFQAIGYSLEALTDDDLVILQRGVAQKHGVKAIIGAGTGLGQGFLVWQGTLYEVYPSEGGHCDFAAKDESEDRLLNTLRSHHEHVSWERLVSGSGLVAIFDWLVGESDGVLSDHLQTALKTGDKAAAISSAALSGSDPVAADALSRFISIYAAQIGNFALATLSNGGIYIAGGIAPKILTKMLEPEFIEAICAKGRMKPLLQRMPVKVIVNPEAGLLGATVAAKHMIGNYD